MNESIMVAFPEDDLATMEPGQIFDLLLEYTADVQASDLFLHTEEDGVEISMRRLGTVQKLADISRDLGRHLLTYVKAMADMDISEHRRPMDGRWIHEQDGRRLDVRINTIATLFGEDMTMRIWDREVGLRSIDDIGLPKRDRNTLTSMLSNPSGLILVTGPTGTGKTTTLYACLRHLNDGTRKISTLEDPVEFAIAGIRQAQTYPKLGLDFPELLSNVLRQAPDIIMIGEIRDRDTAATAVRAANSGHLVLATLHAPVAASAVQSMLALGSNSYFLSSCLLGVVAQRLVRTLCANCRVEYDMSFAPETFEPIRSLLGRDEGHAIYGPSGCDDCFEVGYSGRTGLFEIMTMTRDIRQLVSEARPSEEIEREAIRAGMVEFRRAALLKVAQGVTSIEELLRDVPPEHLGLED